MIDIREFLDGDRLNHTIGVFNNIQIISRDELIKDKNYLKMAALLHDIGYSEKIKKKDGHHSLDGYFHIKDSVPVIVSYLVLMHTGAERLIPTSLKKLFDKEKRWCLKRLKREMWDAEKVNKLLMYLNWADIHTSSTGEFISSKERLRIVEEKYGKGSAVAESLGEEIEKLYNY